MTRRLLMLVGALLLIGGAAIAYRLSVPKSELPAARPATSRPTLALLTSLPLMFGESFALDSGGSPALARLEQRYNVQPIGVADAASLAGKTLLLMAHPRAQPAEALVELDEWVRKGGRVLLLADPKLDWESGRPLGDSLRPPPEFADTGLLAHWGLTFDGPTVDGPAEVSTAEMPILAASPGRLTSSGSCRVEPGGFVARCQLGRGAATIIADSDFLNVGGPGALDGPTGRNLDLLMTELARFDTR